MGWNIKVNRLKEGGDWPATLESRLGISLASWTAFVDGRRWLDELVKEGLAINLGGNDYPSRYTATAKNLLPRIPVHPPEAVASRGGDASLQGGKLDRAAATLCLPEEWLVVELWDTT